MRKPDAESVVPSDVDTTDMAPGEEVELYQRLRASEGRLLGPGTPEQSPPGASHDKTKQQRVIGAIGIDVTNRSPAEIEGMKKPGSKLYGAELVRQMRDEIEETKHRRAAIQALRGRIRGRRVA